jgi:hypothetical protein
MKLTLRHKLLANIRTRIDGNLENYSETGTEYSSYSVQEVNKSYEGLHGLKNNDYLVISKNKKIIWEGFISQNIELNLTYKIGYPYPVQLVDGLVVSWVQDNVNLEEWNSWFKEELEATLYPVPYHKPLKFGNIQLTKKMENFFKNLNLA